MATSQPDDYGVNKKAGAAGTTVAVDSRSGTSGSGSSSGSQSGSQSGTTSQTSTTNSTTRNMSTQNEAQLNALINQLLSGGTPEMKAQAAARRGEIATVQGTREGFNKDDAFNDAQGLIAQQMRRALEAALPGISRAAEDAGSSGGALRALLLQDASQRAAESSSALGAQQAVQYGNINANLSQVLEGLTRSDPTVANALIAALNTAKGAVTSTSGTTTTTGTTTGNTNQISTGNTTTKEDKAIDYAPFGSNTTAKTGGVTYFGPENANPSGVPVGSTLDLLTQLAKPDAWASYKF